MLLLTLSISTMFLYVPHTGSIGFLMKPMMLDEFGRLVEIRLSYNQYFWAFCEHLIMVIFALIIWDESKDYKNLLLLFVWIQILDMLGFVLSYKDPLHEYIITFNWIKVFVFSLAIGIELWRHKRRD